MGLKGDEERKKGVDIEMGTDREDRVSQRQSQYLVSSKNLLRDDLKTELFMSC